MLKSDRIEYCKMYRRFILETIQSAASITIELQIEVIRDLANSLLHQLTLMYPSIKTTIRYIDLVNISLLKEPPNFEAIEILKELNLLMEENIDI